MDPRILSPKLPAPTGTEGVYVGLDDLIRIQHKARGFTFLPRQPLHSLLAGRHAAPGAEGRGPSEVGFRRRRRAKSRFAHGYSQLRGSGSATDASRQ